MIICVIQAYNNIEVEMEGIELWFASTFGEYAWLGILLFAMLPIAECRLAIPFGLSSVYWGNGALKPWLVFLCSYIGSLIPGIVIVLCMKPLLKLIGKSKRLGRLGARMQSYFASRGSAIVGKSGIMRDIGIILFISVPIPFTGVWTGSVVASLLNLPTWRKLLDVSIGAAIACSIVMLISTIFKDYLTIVIIMLVSLMGLYVLYMLLRLIIYRRANIKTTNSTDKKTL